MDPSLSCSERITIHHPQLTYLHGKIFEHEQNAVIVRSNGLGHTF